MPRLNKPLNLLLSKLSFIQIFLSRDMTLKNLITIKIRKEEVTSMNKKQSKDSYWKNNSKKITEKYSRGLRISLQF
jgi:hypothetical protein